MTASLATLQDLMCDRAPVCPCECRIEPREVSRFPRSPMWVFWKRTYRPTVAECEREIVEHWFLLISELRQAGGRETWRARGLSARLYHLGTLRQRAAKRETAQVRA